MILAARRGWANRSPLLEACWRTFGPWLPAAPPANSERSEVVSYWRRWLAGSSTTRCSTWTAGLAARTAPPTDSSAEGHATNRLLALVYQLAGYAPTPRHLHDRHDRLPDELNLRGAYYAAYHEREHLSYAELGLEDTVGE